MIAPSLVARMYVIPNDPIFFQDDLKCDKWHPYDPCYFFSCISTLTVKAAKSARIPAAAQMPAEIIPTMPTRMPISAMMHQLRRAAPRRSLWRKATFETLHRTFLKIAMRIEELKSRVKIALPSAYPYQPALISIAGRITAQGP